MITVGLGGVARHGCVALSDADRLIAVCEQERVTRVRGAGFNPSGLPDEALDLVLRRVGRSRKDVSRYVVADVQHNPGPSDRFERVDLHFAHAYGGYLSSSFRSAAIVVCSHESPQVSVWEGRGDSVTRVDWPWTGPGFADVYTRCASAFGFRSEAGAQRLEALARLCPDNRHQDLDKLLTCDGSSLGVSPALDSWIETQISGGSAIGSLTSARLAAALQNRLIELFIEFLATVRRTIASDQVCLSGSLFYHSSINSAAKRSGIFNDVFIPVDPGSGGLAVGTALHASGRAPQSASPFLGPEFSADEIKETLDNCKLQYCYESEEAVTSAAVKALQNGTLVGWFDGAMEWGPRALGARCILANPISPYVLENLNRFLKRREPWRGYAVSGSQDAVAELFDGPERAPFMECDYRPRDPQQFSKILPSAEAAIRVHTVDDDSPPRFRRLLRAFAAATGVPVLVNTSFNGFHEPIVCSPRDAVRVFYGSGLDMLIIDKFILRK